MLESCCVVDLEQEHSERTTGSDSGASVRDDRRLVAVDQG